MPLIKFKPTSPGRRNQSGYTFEEITKSEPEKALTSPHKIAAGRNNRGVITIRRQGGGVKQALRSIDFKRDKRDIIGEVVRIEKDPNRNAFIALIKYSDGDLRYIIQPQGLMPGNKIKSGDNVEASLGNALPLKNVPVGTAVHNIEIVPGKGGQMIRSAGTYGQLMAKEKGYVQIKLPSGEVRMVLDRCRATVGQLGNLDHENISLGKAGRSRLMGRRPKVRGVVMNPVDHPHGGGEGRTSGGRHPVTPWGVPTKGYKTRKKSKTSGKFIVKRRK